MWITLIAGLLLGAAGEFDVQTLDGRSLSGRLVEFSPQAIVLETTKGRTNLSLESLATVTGREQAAEFRKPTLWVELVDGSGLPGLEYTVKSERAAVRLPSGLTVEVPTQGIRWVRFTPPSDRDAKMAQQWADVTELKATGDLLVVRTGESLDHLEGVLGDMDAETCKFELEGETRSVRRTRIEGLVYFHSRETERPEALALVNTSDGARLSMAEAKIESGAIELATTGGVKLSIPLDQVSRIDFSSGKVAYLSDLDAESATFVPYFGLKEEQSAIRDFFQYRRDISFEQQPLRLDGATFAKGLAVHSRTHLAFKLPGKFRVLKTTLGIDDIVRETGSVRVEIKGDGKVLWQGDVRGSDPPKELELPVEGVRRLEIVCDYGEDQDIGDRLILGDARVMK